ncbi:asparagine synthase (glutamine-hydrolyzing) [Candidatus Omnitrophota bacterium]
MCAIIGIVNLDRKAVDEKVLWDMTDALAHRGPDDRGIHTDGFVGLGHRRLSIIDLSERAHQPMKTENGDLVITYNGEIYNFKELKEILIRQGVTFRSRSDTEIVLNGLAEWGPDALTRFNGMFSFAAWDRKNKTLLLARDRYGIKPLYYWQNGGTFLFASEIKAFLKNPQFKVELDMQALFEYFTFQNTFTYRTLFKGVRLLPPGNFLQISFNEGTKMTSGRYWDFNFEDAKSAGSEEEYCEEFDRLFRQAVSRQLVSDVEVGSYLSGGIDTGSIVAVSSKYFGQLKTFCIGFDMSSASGMELAFDEREKAEQISYLYQTEHYERVLKSGDMKRCMPGLIWALEDLRLGQSYPNFYVSKLASSFVKVCLSGTGGDELFAGYPWRYYSALENKDLDGYIDGYYRYWQRLVPNDTMRGLFAPSWKHIKGICTKDIFKDVLNGHKPAPLRSEDYINNSLYFEAKTFLHGLFVVDDKLSMANGLEMRVPFLDNDLVDFAMKVPVRLKLKNISDIQKIDEDAHGKKNKYFQKTRDGKMILRKALGRYINGQGAYQRKQGFSGPDASWFRGESIDYIKEVILDPKARIYDYLDYSTARGLVDQHIEGRQNRRLFIWSLLCFEWWLKIFMKA